jgi:uncharacterized protein YukE
MLHCQIFKQKIEEIKEKAKILENLLIEYKSTGNGEIAKQFEREFKRTLQEIERFKEEFRNRATRLVEEFIQRRDDKDVEVKIIFDEKDLRFIINGGLDFRKREHLNDFPNLIKEIDSLFAYNVKALYLPHLKKANHISVDSAQIIVLPNLEEVNNFYADSAKTLKLPKLKKAWTIYANNAEVLNLSKLEDIRKLSVKKIEILNLPNLKYAGEILAENAKIVKLPKLERDQIFMRIKLKFLVCLNLK